MRTNRFIFITFVLTQTLFSCSKITPAGFWESYKKELLLESLTDQGAYGGHRAIYWKRNQINTFKSRDVIEFAKENGWTLIDSAAFTAEETYSWKYNNLPVFPLSSNGFCKNGLNDSQVKHFPRWFDGELKVYKFKTGWVLIDPGTDNSIEENGFIVIKDDGTGMAVYHLWGE